jgi:hypothetical protein
MESDPTMIEVLELLAAVIVAAAVMVVLMVAISAEGWRAAGPLGLLAIAASTAVGWAAWVVIHHEQ